MSLPKQRWKAVCAYDGTDFLGWQSQRGGGAIQDLIEAKLEMLLKTPTRIHGSGRTDSGVHAKGQVFHFDAHWPYGAEKLHKALQGAIPSSIQIIRLKATHKDFHARNHASLKRYTYSLFLGQAPPNLARYCWSIPHTLDFLKMRQAAQQLLGTHDFRAFAALRRDDSHEQPIKTLYRLDLQQRGKHLKITAEADSFLYKMVRSLVGALVEVGRGKLPPSDLPRFLKNPKRPPAVVCAPPQGLSLEKVVYGKKGGFSGAFRAGTASWK